MTSLYFQGRHWPDAGRIEDSVRLLLQIAHGNIIRINTSFQVSAEAKLLSFIYKCMENEWDKIPSERSKIYEAFVPESERSTKSYELWNKSLNEAIEDYGFHREMTLDGVTHLIPSFKESDIFDLMWDASSHERLTPPRLMAYFDSAWGSAPEGGHELVWNGPMFFGARKWVYGTQSDF